MISVVVSFSAYRTRVTITLGSISHRLHPLLDSWYSVWCPINYRRAMPKIVPKVKERKWGTSGHGSKQLGCNHRYQHTVDTQSCPESSREHRDMWSHTMSRDGGFQVQFQLMPITTFTKSLFRQSHGKWRCCHAYDLDTHPTEQGHGLCNTRCWVWITSRPPIGLRDTLASPADKSLSSHDMPKANNQQLHASDGGRTFNVVC